MTAKVVAAAATTGWRNRITGAGEEAPDQLLANPANWRIHPKAQQDALAGALDAVGWVQQVLVNQRTGFVVDGHARVALAISRNEPSVPVLYVDLDPDEEALVLAILDPIGAMAGRDDEKLRALLADVTVDDAGLLALLGDLGGSEPKAGLTDPDEVPEPPEEPYVQPGDLYRLGDHRILCGDATNSDDVARLLDGAAPTLLATDPPYGVQLDQTWRDGVYNGPRKRVKGWGVVAGAEKPYMMREVPDAEAGDGEPAAMRGHHTAGHRNTSISMDTRADWSEAFALVPSLQVGYVWYASIHTLEVLSGLQTIGFELAGQIIWDKGLFSVGRSWYHWAHEPCVVVRRPGVPNLSIGGARPVDDLARAQPQAGRGWLQGDEGGPPDPEAGAAVGDPDPEPPPAGRGGLRAVLRFRHDADGGRDPRSALLRDGDRPQVRPGRDRALAALHRPDRGARRSAPAVRRARRCRRASSSRRPSVPSGGPYRPSRTISVGEMES
jgi:hypothetical protein